jgi:hypothetical protein
MDGAEIFQYTLSEDADIFCGARQELMRFLGYPRQGRLNFCLGNFKCVRQ